VARVWYWMLAGTTNGILEPGMQFVLIALALVALAAMVAMATARQFPSSVAAAVAAAVGSAVGSAVVAGVVAAPIAGVAVAVEMGAMVAGVGQIAPLCAAEQRRERVAESAAEGNCDGASPMGCPAPAMENLYLPS
jgi:predicted lipid-binding transport protein (Tim44 family)